MLVDGWVARYRDHHYPYARFCNEGILRRLIEIVVPHFSRVRFHRASRKCRSAKGTPGATRSLHEGAAVSH